VASTNARRPTVAARVGDAVPSASHRTNASSVARAPARPPAEWNARRCSGCHQAAVGRAGRWGEARSEVAARRPTSSADRRTPQRSGKQRGAKTSMSVPAYARNTTPTAAPALMRRQQRRQFAPSRARRARSLCGENCPHCRPNAPTSAPGVRYRDYGNAAAAQHALTRRARVV
jgi:hypothetical protein